ncbi:HPP family protein [Devosia sp. A449]
MRSLGAIVPPVLAGSSVLLLAAIIYNRLTRKAYPHRPSALVPIVSRGAGGGLGVTTDDLSAAIRERDEVLPVDPADLEEVLQRRKCLPLPAGRAASMRRQ